MINKVLKYTPNDKEVKDKIEACYFELDPDFVWEPRYNSFQSALYGFTVNTWSYLAIIFSFLLAISIVFIRTPRSLFIKRIALIGGVLSLALIILSFVTAFNLRSYQNDDRHAVVTNKIIPTFLENGKTAQKTLSEGLALCLVGSDSTEFVDVIAPSGEKYLVKHQDLSFI